MTDSPGDAESPRIRRRIRAAWFTVAVLHAAASAWAGGPVLSSPTAPRAATVVDPNVVPAGGAQCRQCGAGVCPLHREHSAACRDGVCAPHCPVRPSQYGFYRTQWRRWPDQGVTPVGAEEAATPARPPKSLVPSADEESPRPPTADSAPATSDDAGATSPADPAVRPNGGAGPLPTEPIPEDPVGTEPAGRVPPVPPGEQPVPPLPEAAGGLPDQSAAPIDDGSLVVEVGTLRYPAGVGGSIAAGAVPWRLAPAARQRPADSARGL